MASSDPVTAAAPLEPSSPSLPSAARRFESNAALRWIALVLLSSCASPHPPAIPAYEIRERIRQVSIGQSIGEAHRIMGRDSVSKPRHPESPIPTPLHVLELVDGEGHQVRVETYVIDVWRAKGCPDFHYRDVPIAFRDGRVLSLEWNYLEWHWQSWGGSLADLRLAQDRFRCDDPAEPSVSEDSGSTSSVSPRTSKTRISDPARTGASSADTSALHNSDPTRT